MAAILDAYVEKDYEIEFYPMQSGEPPALLKFDDRTFAGRVVEQMENRSKALFHCGEADEGELVERISESKLVVSLRFHGNIFSTIVGKPFIGICSHDKMSQLFPDLGINNFTDYYGFRKASFQKVLSEALPTPEALLEIAERERNKWLPLSDIVAKKFGM